MCDSNKLHAGNCNQYTYIYRGHRRLPKELRGGSAQVLGIPSAFFSSLLLGGPVRTYLPRRSNIIHQPTVGAENYLSSGLLPSAAPCRVFLGRPAPRHQLRLAVCFGAVAISCALPCVAISCALPSATQCTANCCSVFVWFEASSCNSQSAFASDVHIHR